MDAICGAGHSLISESTCPLGRYVRPSRLYKRTALGRSLSDSTLSTVIANIMNKVVLLAFVALSVVCYLAAPVNGAPQHKEHEAKHGDAPRHEEEQKKPFAHDQHPKVHDQRPKEHAESGDKHDGKLHAKRDVKQTEEEQKKPIAHDQRPKEQATGEPHGDRLPHPRPPTRRRYSPSANAGGSAAGSNAPSANRAPYKPTTAAAAPGSSTSALGQVPAVGTSSAATPAVPAASPAAAASSTTVKAPSSGPSARVSASSTAAPSVPSVSTSAAPLPAVLG